MFTRVTMIPEATVPEGIAPVSPLRNRSVKVLTTSFKDLLSARNRLSQTPMYSAAIAGKTESINWLNDNGFNSDERDISDWTPFAKVSAAQLFGAARFLLQLGADLDTVSSSGTTPLWSAVCANHPAEVKFLLEHGADPTISFPGPGDTTERILDMAKRNGHTEITALILEHLVIGIFATSEAIVQGARIKG